MHSDISLGVNCMLYLLEFNCLGEEDDVVDDVGVPLRLYSCCCTVKVVPPVLRRLFEPLMLLFWL